MIFQRGNPLDYERWARRPRAWSTWDYAHCLPYFKRMENCLAAGPDDPFRGHSGPARARARAGHQPAVRRVLRRRCSRRATRSPTTSTGTGRRASPPSTATSTADGGCPRPRAYLHPVMSRPNLDVRTRALVTKMIFDGTRAVGVEYSRLGQAPSAPASGSRPARSILCGGAINSPQLLQLSGVGERRELLRALGIDVVADLPGVGENLQDHLEVYVQHACTQPVSMQPYLKWRHRPWLGAQWLFGRTGPGARPTTSRPAASSAATRTCDYPNLMFHFLPIAVRYDGSAPAGGPRLPGARRPDVLRRPRHRQDHQHRSGEAPRAAVQLPVHRPGPPGVGGGDPGRPGTSSSQPALRAVQTAARSHPARTVQTDEQILDWVARDAETALHPSCTGRMGTGPMSVRRPAHACGCTDCRGCGWSTPR